MRRYAITNQKGGSGKTTTAVNLAAALGALGDRVLLVDVDGQRNASTWLDSHPDSPGVWELIARNWKLEDVVQKTDVPGVDLVAGSQDLFSLDRALAREQGAEVILRERLESTFDSDEYDWIFFDCPPSLTMATTSALVAAQEAFVTVEAKSMPLEGLSQLIQTIQKVQRRLNPALRLGPVLMVRASRTNLSDAVIGSARENLPENVLNTVVRENVALAEAYDARQPIGEYAPGSHGAVDYTDVAKEVKERG